MTFFAAGCGGTFGNAKPPERFPELELTSLEAQRTSVSSVIAGKPALVAFWATWCTACADEFDALNRLDSSAKQRGAVVLGIAVGEEHAKVADFVHRRGLAYPQLVDEDFRLTEALGQHRLPTILVVDRHGKVIYSGGKLDAQALASFQRASDSP